MPTMPGRSYSSLLLAASNFGIFAFPFMRGVVLARLLSPQNFGLAISITTVASVVEIISDVGINQFAVRVSDPEAIPTLHSVALVRAMLLAVTIAACGPLFAYVFNAPGTAWVYTLVGCSSLIRGFSHLNAKIAMRSFNFATEAIQELVGHLTWTVVSIGTAFIFRDYRAMVLGIVAYSVASVVTTHLLSRTRWRLGWDRAVVKEAARFGRPLIPNGAAIVVVNMGDRTLVGSYLGLDALAYYSVLSTSAFLPRSAVVRFLTGLMTPQFVTATTQAQSDRLLTLSAIIVSFVGSFFAFGYMAFGSAVIGLVFGSHYAVPQGIVSLVAILSCIRFLATLANPVGLAKGDTGLVFLNTATSAGGLLLGFLLVLRSPTLDAMVSGMCIGEVAALIFIVRKLLRSHPVIGPRVWSAVLPTLALVFGCAATIVFAGVETMLPKIGIGAGFTAAEIALLSTILFSGGLSIRNVAGVFLPRRLQMPP